MESFKDYFNFDELINEIYINKECLTKRGISLDSGFQRKKH